MNGTRILVVDDEASIRHVIRRALEAEGATVDTFETRADAEAALRAERYDLAICDIRLPDGSGLDLLSACRAEGIEVPILIVTAESTMANAVEAMKRGAFDYVTKPFDLDELCILARRALDMERLTRTVDRLQEEVGARYTPGEGLVGRTPAMQEIYKTIGRIAGSDATVLIEGESGTGKELIARALHFHSGRAGAFVAVNCAAIPRDLLESELFGHERGAFTGAVERRLGSFERAEGGTLFFDEVGELPLDLQAKLLRVLQEREFTRVGGRDVLHADVRVVAATNRRLEEQVRAHAFREDLYFRLAVVPLRVPPLRERRADIPDLIRFFVDRINRETGSRITGITPEAAAMLGRHAWPGNVRELENVLRRACVLASGRTLGPDDFDLSGDGDQVAVDAPAEPVEAVIRTALRRTYAHAGDALPTDLHALAVSWIERPLIELVLERTNGNQVRAAEILGINRNTLRKKITQLGIRIPR